MSHRCNHDPVRVVARQPLFASLSEEECEALVRRSVCRRTSRGESLFREGEPCRGIYLVVEGAVRTYRSNSSGDEQVFGIFRAGDSLGDVSLFDEGPYLASARVMEGGRVLFLGFDEVQALYHTHPCVARAVVRELGERVRALASLVDMLSLQDVPTRVAWAVLRHARQRRTKDLLRTLLWLAWLILPLFLGWVVPAYLLAIPLWFIAPPRITPPVHRVG